MGDVKKVQAQFPDLIKVYAGVKDSSKWLDLEEIVQITGVNIYSVRRLVPMLHRLGVFDRTEGSHSFLYKISDNSRGMRHILALETTLNMIKSRENLISSSVEYLHFGGNKAEGRGQRAEGKEQGCKVEVNDNCLAEHDIKSKLQ